MTCERRRPPLSGPTEVDVAIVGGGYTASGRRTTSRAATPALRIVVLEREFAGFGASGPQRRLAVATCSAGLGHDRGGDLADDAVAWQRAANATVDEVLAVAAGRGHRRRRRPRAASSAWPPSELQAARLRESVEQARAWGFGEDDLRWLSRRRRERVAADRVLGGTWSAALRRRPPRPAGAGPGRGRGAARRHDPRGHPVTGSTPHVARTPFGDVRRRSSSARSRGTPARCRPRRDLLPLYSLMLATEPLPDDFWKEVDWSGRRR